MKFSLKIVLGGCLVVGLITTYGFFFSSQSDHSPLERLEASQAIDGSRFQAQTFLGKNVLVHFWAAWCEPCIDEIPELLAAVRKPEAFGNIPFIAVSLDEKWESAFKIFPKTSLTPNLVTLLLDPNQKVSESWGSFKYPETYLLGKNGLIVNKWVGPQPWLDSKFQDHVKKLIS